MQKIRREKMNMIDRILQENQSQRPSSYLGKYGKRKNKNNYNHTLQLKNKQ